MMRETCICADADGSTNFGLCHSSSKRSRKTSRSRAVSVAHSRWSVPRSSAREVVRFDADGVTQRAGVLIGRAEGSRCIKGDHAVRATGLQRVHDVLLTGAEGCDELLDGGLAMTLIGELSDGPFDCHRAFLQSARHPHRPCAIAEVALDLAEVGQRSSSASSSRRCAAATDCRPRRCNRAARGDCACANC